MDLFAALAARHSYRGPFQPAPVPRADLERIVQAALLAPSGRNGQTTRFVIVDEPALVRQIAALHATNVAVQQAQAFVACVVERDPPPIYEQFSFAVEDCAATVIYMWLALTDLGYASVWIDGWLRLEQRAERIGAWLGVPADRVIRVLLPIGVPVEQRCQPEKKPLAERAWFNRYGG
jgi:nitroreductase